MLHLNSVNHKLINKAVERIRFTETFGWMTTNVCGPRHRTEHLSVITVICQSLCVSDLSGFSCHFQPEQIMLVQTTQIIKTRLITSKPKMFSDDDVKLYLCWKRMMNNTLLIFHTNTVKQLCICRAEEDFKPQTPRAESYHEWVGKKKEEKMVWGEGVLYHYASSTSK